MTREERIAKIRGRRWIRYPLAGRIGAKLDDGRGLHRSRSRVPILRGRARRPLRPQSRLDDHDAAASRAQGCLETGARSR
jgi:hypothetical protein